MSDPRTDSLHLLSPRPVAATLKSEFFRVMPAIEDALRREVPWKDILADLARNGLTISPTLASNYAAQYRRRHRPAGEPGRPGRPRKVASPSAGLVEAPTVPVLVAETGHSSVQRKVADLVRPEAIA